MVFMNDTTQGKNDYTYDIHGACVKIFTGDESNQLHMEFFREI